jgi:Protein of unknown function (DUF2510)
VSVPVPDTRLRVRVGKSAGTFVQGAETPTLIDTGNISITTQRIVFQGDKYTREWDYSKLIGLIHYSDKPATAIQVSNREKTSGIVYAGVNSTEPVRLAMTVAIAIYRGETEETIKELRDELAKLDGTGPASSPSTPDAGPTPAHTEQTDGGGQSPTPEATTAPSPMETANSSSTQTSSSGSPPPEWAADPTGRHQWRYWDGSSWTDVVADNDKESRDPLGDHPS